MTGKDGGKAELRFPVNWTFRIIAESGAGGCRNAIQEVFRGFSMSPAVCDGAESAHGRYRTYVATVEIPSRTIFDELPCALAGAPGVKMVL